MGPAVAEAPALPFRRSDDPFDARELDGLNYAANGPIGQRAGDFIGRGERENSEPGPRAMLEEPPVLPGAPGHARLSSRSTTARRR